MHRKWLVSGLAFSCLIAFLLIAPAGAQTLPPAGLRAAILTPATGSGEASGTTLLTVNVALGAFTSGVWSSFAGRAFWPAFARGAGAGAMVFTGKRIIAAQTPLAWWTGRQVAALATSEMRNAAEGRPFLQRVALPLGPLRIHVDRTAGFRVVPKLDLATALSTIAAAARPTTRFGWRESISTGSVAFTARDMTEGVGTHFAGVITVASYLPNGSFPPLQRKTAVLSHELIHATQYDFLSVGWSGPLEDAISSRVPVLGRVHRYLDFGLLTPAQIGLNRLISPARRPWEQEAGSLASGY